MSDTVLIFVLTALGIGIGFLFGMLISNLRNTKDGVDKKTLSEDFQTGSEINGKLGDTHYKQLKTKPDDKSVSDLEFGEQENKRIQLNPIEIFTRAFQAEIESQNPYERSISEQIDEILQQMLEGESLKSRAIRLMELPSKGMVVMVGLDQYQDVNTIPDEDVRNIIHTAVAEWERRVTEERQIEEVSDN